LDLDITDMPPTSVETATPRPPTSPRSPRPPRSPAVRSSDGTANGAANGGEKPRIDGRVARSQRTVTHIVQALLELLERDGDLRPTAHQVARRAGVSRRALYLHFDSLDVLFATAASRRASEVFSAWETPPLDTPLPGRIDWFVRHWSALCEALLPLHRAAALYEPFSEEVQATFDRARIWGRSAVELVFRPELASTPAQDRETLARALHHITSWTGWNDLRCHGASVDEAAAAMQRLLTALLDN
jgi:TetR/AcrR family transcriptional regulator, regulator of autoinduction and epiphytic fitness